QEAWVMAFQTYVLGTNQAPTADAGMDQTVTVPHDGNPATNTASFSLNGSGSSDPDGDTLSYAWKLDGADIGSTAVLEQNRPAGSYNFTLTVSDPAAASQTDGVTVTVEPEPNQN